MRTARRLSPLLLALGLAGCAIPQWNPAWVPVWVPFLGADRGEPPPRRAPQPPRVVERAPISDDDQTLTERVVAVVNNDAITLGELEEAMAAARADTRQRPQGSDEQIKREFLNRFIESRLQLQEAEREKIVVEEAEIDDELLLSKAARVLDVEVPRERVQIRDALLLQLGEVHPVVGAARRGGRRFGVLRRLVGLTSFSAGAHSTAPGARRWSVAAWGLAVYGSRFGLTAGWAPDNDATRMLPPGAKFVNDSLHMRTSMMARSRISRSHVSRRASYF